MYTCARLDHKTIRRVFLFTAVFFFCAHLYRFCTLGFTHDSLLIDQSQDTAFQLSLGRFMQPVYWLIRGDISVPFLIGLLAYTYLALSIVLIASLLRIRSTLSIALTCTILSANATLSVGNATYISWTDVYMLALFLSTLSVYLFCRFRFGFLAAPFLLCASLALYQSYLQTAVLLYLMVLVHRVLDKITVRTVFFDGLLIIAVLLAGLLLYAFIYPRILVHAGIGTATTYNGLSGVGDYSGLSLETLIKEAYFYPFQSALHPQTYLPSLAVFLYALLFAVTVIAIALLAHGYALPAASLGMLVLLLACMPLGANIIYVISKGMVHILMCYSFFLSFVFPISLVERLTTERHIPARAMRMILTVSFSALYLCNVAFAGQLYLRRDLEMQSTLSLMSRVIDRMEQTEGYVPGKTPVAFVGTLFDTPLFMNRPGFEHLSTLMGSSNLYAITAETYYPWYIHQVLGYPMQILNESERVQMAFREDVLAMPVFPEDGCCRMIDGTLVIRLGGRSVLPDTILK